MKQVKKWLPLGLTCLVVLAAALLPQKLSRARDAQLLGQVHAEELTVEGSLPSRPATLEEKLALLGMWSRDETTAVYLSQVLLRNAEGLQEDSSSLESVFSTAVRSFAEAGILPEQLSLESMTLTSGERVLLRSQSSGVSASYLNLWGMLGNYSEGYLNMVLDEDTGAVYGLSLFWPGALKYLPPPDEVGSAFFQALGLEAELLGGGKWEALFLLPECGLQYIVSFSPDTLDIMPIDSQSNAGAGTNDAG